MITDTIVTGMVISAMPVGEYDTRITLLTREKGKISAFVRGARKPRSQFAAGSRPFSFGRFTLYMGKNSNSVSDMEISNYFSDISKDISATYYGFYFLELADYYGRENLDAKDTIVLIYQSLRALINKNIPDRLVRVIFELKLLVYNGEYPQMFQCVKCQEKEKLTKFSALAGGMICDKCASHFNDVIDVNVSTIYTMQYIITSKVESLYRFQVVDNVQVELELIMKRYFACYVDKSFKSLEILNTLEYNVMD